MTDTGREDPEVWIDDVGMMSCPIIWQSWSEESDGPYAGKASGVSLVFFAEAGLDRIFPDYNQNDEKPEWFTAVDEVLKDYKGLDAAGSGDYANHVMADFGVAYLDNETDDEMVLRIERETDFTRFYNHSIIFFTFQDKVAEKLGYVRVLDDEGDHYVRIDQEVSAS